MKKILITAVVLIVITVAAYFFIVRLFTTSITEGKVRLEMSTICIALKHYAMKYGKLPGDSNRQVVDVLRMCDKNGATIITIPEDKLNDKGEIIDLWGTPYRFYLSCGIGVGPA